MNMSRIPAPLSPSRRRLLLAGAAGALAPPILTGATAAPPITEYRLVARGSRTRIVPEPHPETDVWSYNGAVPGPEIRLRQGDRLRVAVENHLKEATTVHWHGIRLPNAMDGVP